MNDIRLLKEEICEIGRRMYFHQLSIANDGNISCRLDNGLFLITPTQFCKGDMKPEDIVVIDSEMHLVEGNRRPSTEVRVHLKAYSMRPDVNAVIHAHAPFSTAFAVRRESLMTPAVPSIFSFVGPVPCTRYGTPSTDELAECVGEYVSDYNAMLLANHGSLTLGKDLKDAFFKTERLELLCKVTLLSRLLGGEINFSNEDIKKLNEKYERQKREGIF